jgi:hypothetical protein
MWNRCGLSGKIQPILLGSTTTAIHLEENVSFKIKMSDKHGRPGLAYKPDRFLPSMDNRVF